MKKQEEFNQKINIINYAVPKDHYDRLKDLIREVIVTNAKSALGWDCKLTVRIVKENKKSKGDMACVIVSDKNYLMYLFEPLIKVLSNGYLNYFDNIIGHEFCHIIDMQNALDCKHTKVKVNKRGYKTKKEYYIKKGFDFWTELFAYKFAYRYSTKKEIDNPTTYENIRNLLQIEKQANSIYCNKTDLSRKVIKGYKKSIDTFTYEITKTYANFLLNGEKKYSKRTKNHRFYHLQKEFYGEIKPIIKRINKSPFNKDFDNNFKELGKTICEYFYEPLGIRIEYHDKHLSECLNM